MCFRAALIAILLHIISGQGAYVQVVDFNRQQGDDGWLCLGGCRNARFHWNETTWSLSTRPVPVPLDTYVRSPAISIRPSSAPFRLRFTPSRPVTTRMIRLGNELRLDLARQLPSCGPTEVVNGTEYLCVFDAYTNRQERFHLTFIAFSSMQPLTLSNMSIEAYQCSADVNGSLTLPMAYATATFNSSCPDNTRADPDAGYPTFRCEVDQGWQRQGEACRTYTTTPGFSGPSSSASGLAVNGVKTKASSKSSNAGAVAGIVIGSLLALAMLSFVLLYWHRRQRGKLEHQPAQGLAQQMTMNLHYNDIQKQFVRPDDYEDPTTYAQTSDVLGLLNKTHTPRLAGSDVITTLKLGEGAFGEVFLGEMIFLGKKRNCAVKKLQADASDQDKCDFLKEAAIMAHFEHPNVLSLLAVVAEEGSSTMIVLELMVNGSLLGFLTNKTAEATPPRLDQMGRDIAQGMAYLSNRGFVHRDLAARNVLVSHDYSCKVADFGLSRQLSLDDSDTTTEYYVSQGGMIAVRWMAPEVLDAGKYATASDVWSFGVTLWEMFSFGLRPYGDIETNRQVYAFLLAGKRMSQPEHASDQWYAIMTSCWKSDFHDRPSFDDLVTRIKKMEADTIQRADADKRTVIDGFDEDNIDALEMSSQGLSVDYVQIETENSVAESCANPDEAAALGSKPRYEDARMHDERSVDELHSGAVVATCLHEGTDSAAHRNNTSLDGSIRHEYVNTAEDEQRDASASGGRQNSVDSDDGRSYENITDSVLLGASGESHVDQADPCTRVRTEGEGQTNHVNCGAGSGTARNLDGSRTSTGTGHEYVNTSGPDSDMIALNRGADLNDNYDNTINGVQLACEDDADVGFRRETPNMVVASDHSTYVNQHVFDTHNNKEATQAAQHASETSCTGSQENLQHRDITMGGDHTYVNTAENEQSNADSDFQAPAQDRRLDEYDNTINGMQFVTEEGLTQLEIRSDHSVGMYANTLVNETGQVDGVPTADEQRLQSDGSVMQNEEHEYVNTLEQHDYVNTTPGATSLASKETLKAEDCQHSNEAHAHSELESAPKDKNQRQQAGTITTTHADATYANATAIAAHKQEEGTRATVERALLAITANRELETDANPGSMDIRSASPEYVNASVIVPVQGQTDT